MSSEVTLRYFDARGRAQFLRYYLQARELRFEDERVALSEDFSEWSAIRDDQSKTGPFKKLPVLRWGDGTIAETLVIGSFLHVELGDADKLDLRANRRHAMLTSSLYHEILLPVGMLVWADRIYSGIDMSGYAERTLANVTRHMTTLNDTLADWSWPVPTSVPSVADCLLWDMLNTCSHVFGAAIVVDELETLARFYEHCAGRPVFEKLLATHPCPLTARPDEAAKIAEIQKLLTPG